MIEGFSVHSPFIEKSMVHHKTNVVNSVSLYLHVLILNKINIKI